MSEEEEQIGIDWIGIFAVIGCIITIIVLFILVENWNYFVYWRHLF